MSLKVLENIISMLLLYISPKFWRTVDDFIIFCTCEFLLLTYCNYFRNVAFREKPATNLINKLVGSSVAVQYHHNTSLIDTSQFSKGPIFVLINGACFICAVEGNVLEKCPPPEKCS